MTAVIRNIMGADVSRDQRERLFAGVICAGPGPVDCASSVCVIAFTEHFDRKTFAHAGFRPRADREVDAAGTCTQADGTSPP